MALDRDKILSSIGYPTDTVEVERWGGGGTITVQGIPLGHDQLNAYLSTPVSFPTMAEVGSLPKLGKNASANEKAAARIAAQVAGAAMTHDFRRPDIEEIIKRQTVGAVVLGATTSDGEPLFTWDDVDYIRRELDWGDTLKVAARILELSQGPDRGPADDDDEPEPVTEAEEPDEGKDSSATTPD